MWCYKLWFIYLTLSVTVIDCNQWSCSVRCLYIHLQEQVHMTDLKTYMEKLLQNYWWQNMIIVQYRTAVMCNSTGLHWITKWFIIYTLGTVSVRITICFWHHTFSVHYTNNMCWFRETQISCCDMIFHTVITVCDCTCLGC